MQKPIDYWWVTIKLSPVMRASRIVVNHAQAILNETPVEKGYLFYPVLFWQYQLILLNNDTLENRKDIIEESANHFITNGYTVDITEGGFRIYFG